MLNVVIACHFKDRNTLCETTKRRLDAAVLGSRSIDGFLVTGDVPYEPGGPTLAELMKQYLVSKGVLAESIAILHGGVGTFSEARLACAGHAGGTMSIYASDWYLKQAQEIWERRAAENGVLVYFAPVKGTGGLRTRLVYGVLAVAMEIAYILGVENWFEQFLTRSQHKRTEGFTWNGCA